MTSKYINIYNSLKSDIINNVFPKNTLLPAGAELAKRFQTSILTVSKAINLLEKEGYLVRKRGFGTVVKNWSLQNQTLAFDSLFIDTSQEVRSEIIKFEIINVLPEIMETLSISDNEAFVYHIQRLIFINNKAIILENSYISLDLIAGLRKEHLNKNISLYIEEILQLQIHSSSLQVQSSQASELASKLLKLKENQNIIKSTKISFLDDGNAFEYLVSEYILEAFNFKTFLSYNNN